MKRTSRTFIGWARGLAGALREETGVWHAVVEENDPNYPGLRRARADCTTRQVVAGQLEPLPPDARICQRVGCDNARREHT